MAPRRIIRFRHLLCLCLGGLGGPVAGAASGAAATADFFESRIRPVLVEHCHSCHGAGAEKLKADLRLDTRADLLRGGESGPALVPGDPDRSLLLRAVSYEDPDLQMPPKTRLPPGTVADLRQWIRDGAPWPASPAPTPPGTARRGFDLAHRKASHWAWQPVSRPAVPVVKAADWPTDDLDRFILARLEAAGLAPASPADRRTLLRRASHALTGLPPTPEELETFGRDDAPATFARAVDHWLASPAFGERWARHWLDKVRYAETMGHEFDYPILGAWRYRDYVVHAFNDGLPYSTFVREQIAGDLLPPRWHPETGCNEALIATLQYWLPQQVHSPVDARAYTSEIVDNQIDVLGKAFLGLTLACARCHDHKFDAISTRDYYALHGMLDSSRYAIRAVDDPAPRRAGATRLVEHRDRVRRELAGALLDRLTAPRDASAPPLARSNVWGRFDPPASARVLSPDTWFPEGDALLLDPAPEGQPVWLGEGPLRVVPRGVRHAASLSRRFQGALRSPTFTIDRDFLHLRVAGQGTRFTVCIEGFTLVQAPIYGSLRQSLRNPLPHWRTLDLSMWKGRRAWIVFSDFSAPDPAADFGPEVRQPDGWFALETALLSPDREPPPSLPPVDPVDPAALVRTWRETPDRVAPDDAAWIEAALRDLPLPEEARLAWRREDALLPEPQLAATMTDGTGVDLPVFVRGNHKVPGEIVPRRFLEALGFSDLPYQDASFSQGSGRLALARAVTHPENPLTPRVMVNWIWAHLFGRGLVASVDNLGVLGEPPTHPDLLDHLAADFRRQDAPKALIRRILLSRTWQMSGQASDPAAATARDPDNLLLHRAPLRRLDAESLRDALLAVAGNLDPARGGPPVPAHLTPFMDGRGRPSASGPLDGFGRRSLYLEVRRNFLSPLLLAFDAPIPFTTVGHRNVSNVPAQALALMNDPFVAAQARRWAERVAREFPADPDARVRRLYELAFARLPDAAELRASLDFVRAQGDVAGSNTDTAWIDLAHALFNAKEFAFLP